LNDAHDTGLAPSARPHPDLPAGWRSAEAYGYPHVDPFARARRRRLIIIAVVVAVLVLEGVGVVVWNAQAHYGRGESALAAGADALAVEEFSQATLIGLPYRNAEVLEQQARASLADDLAKREADQARSDRVGARLAGAAAALHSGDAAAVLAAAEAARKAGLVDVAAAAQEVADARRQLIDDLEAAAGTALADGSWKDAGLFAAALVTLDGARDEWSTLTRRAERGARLAALVDRARAAAEQGSWREALRLARQVLQQQSDFPGAARVAERARTALDAARARARAAAAAAAAKDNGTSGGSQTTSPPTSGGGSSSTQPPPP
jgi:hypothetical protein